MDQNLEDLMHSKNFEEAKEYNYECRMYARCMKEIKERLYVIKKRLALGSNEGDKRFDTEVICLQFRSIFELIYLSNLAAHQKLYTKGYDKLKKEWNKARIGDFLHKKNPDFYPTPVHINVQRLENEKIHIDLATIESGYLTKEELNAFYETCSGYIHPRNPFDQENDYKVWLLFPDWISKICKLLGSHVVNMFESKRGLFVYVNFEDTGDKKDMHMVYLFLNKKVIH